MEAEENHSKTWRELYSSSIWNLAMHLGTCSNCRPGRRNSPSLEQTILSAQACAVKNYLDRVLQMSHYICQNTQPRTKPIQFSSTMLL